MNPLPVGRGRRTAPPALLCAAFLSLATSVATYASTNNYALGKPVAVSSAYQAYYASNAVDGVVSDASRWLGAPAAGGNWLEMNLGAPAVLRQAHIYMGYQTQAGSWVTNIQFQAWSGTAWTNIPGGSATNSNAFALPLTFANPVTAARVRFVTTDTTYARVREISLWDEPMPLYAGMTGEYVPDFLTFGEPVLVNQVGYQFGAPKRFTAPTATNGAPFTITTTNSTGAIFSGTVNNGRADFSAFEPAAPGPYLLRVTGPTNGASFPFLITSNLLSGKMVPPAIQFMVDSRSAVGSHPSAYGGCPWRDGTYYSFEIPSLVYLLLNFRDTVLTLPRDIDYEAEKARVLDPGFTNTYVSLSQSAGFLEALRRHYTNNPPPLRTNTPELVQCLHFGVGVTLERPSTKDPSGDPLPQQIHSQTVEWGAYVLHAWPVLRDWLPDSFYQRLRDFTFSEWTHSAPGDPSSFEIDPDWHPTNYTGLQPYKGRHPPGHSILPNLLMYEVAHREGRPDATNFLNAAKAQAQWIVETLDWADPRNTKGHRMSEHKMMPGLALLLSRYPAHAPPGLPAKIQSWVDTMIARGDNLWDFRRYDLTNDWTIPALANNWNEPGNLAGFPACALAAASVITNTVQQQRLRELSWAALDCLFGRNPLNAASPGRPVRLANGHPGGFPDVERGWPRLYSGAAAYLENARGALCSGPGTEHFPYNPDAALRWHEPWVNFNAAWNVGLAYLQADLDGRRDLLAVHLPVVISEILPAPAGNPLAEYIELHNPTPYPARLSGLTIGGSITFAFPLEPLIELAPGARCLLVRDLASFTQQFGAGLPVAGAFSGELPDNGGVLTLGDVNGNTFAGLDYSTLLPPAGASVMFSGGETNFPSGPWSASADPGGSPGSLGETSPERTIVLREGVNGYAHIAALIRGDDVQRNSGARDQLIVGKNQAPLRSVLAFPLELLPANATITSVGLDLWTDLAPGSGAVGALELRALSGAPVEGSDDGTGKAPATGVSWVSRTGGSGFGQEWISSGGDSGLPSLAAIPGYDATVAGVRKSFYSTPGLVSAAQSAFAAGEPFSLLLLSPETEAAPGESLTRIASDDSIDRGRRPRLVVNYTTLAAPSELTATPVSSSEVLLRWVEHFSGETGFLVERRVGEGVWTPVITTGANVRSVTDVGLSAGFAYEYRVRGNYGDGATSGYAYATAVTPPPSSRPPLRILPLGDSITQGYGAPGGYRDPLNTLLAGAAYQVQFLGSTTNNATTALETSGNAAHEGHGGYTTTAILGNLDANAVGAAGNNGGFWFTGNGSSRPPVFPDVILLLAGVNDLGVKQLPPEQGLAGLDALVTRLAALRPLSWIIVSTLPPYSGTTYPNREQNQQIFNAALPDLVAAHQEAGRRVALVDIRTRLNLGNAQWLFTADGVHPNAAGYTEIARVWLEAIRKLPLIENWRAEFFQSPLDSGTAANAVDADRDGRLNFEEFYHGTNPTNAETANPVFTNTLVDAGATYLSITFRRRQHSDIRSLVEVVPEISGFTPWTNRVIQVGPPLRLDGGFEQVTFRDTVPMESAPARFIRLKLFLP